MDWENVLQLSENSGIINTEGGEENGRKILRETEKRSGGRSDGRTAETVRVKQEQAVYSRAGSEVGSNEKKNSRNENSSRRRSVYGDTEVVYDEFDALIEKYKELLYADDSSMDKLDIIEEVMADIGGNILDGNYSILETEFTDEVVDAVNDYFDSAVTDELVEDESGLVEEAKFLAKDYWTPDLTRTQLKQLNELIRRDINTSTKQITDTANWYTTKIDGMKVFAIYSTVNKSNPTLLYESKDYAAELEQELLLDILEEIENGKSVDGESVLIDKILSKRGLPKDSNNKHDTYALARGRSVRNGAILQRQSQRLGSRALDNVLRNLFEIREDVSDGRRDGGKLKFRLKSPIEETRDLIAQHNLRAEDLLGSFDLETGNGADRIEKVNETDEVKLKVVDL